MRKLGLGLIALFALLLTPSFAQEVESDVIARGNLVVTKDLLIYEITEPGSGRIAKIGDQVEVHYTGWLIDGTKFDSSMDREQTFRFRLGAEKVIPGWERGVSGMKIGETRELIIPPNLAYGKQGAGGFISPNAVLLFKIQLLSIN